MKKVDYRDTLVVYLRSESKEEAAKTLNISVANLGYRITKMKKAGVLIPRQRSKAVLTSLEVAQLNSIIKKFNSEKA